MIQTNINFYMLRAEFLAKKTFLTSAGFLIFFPRKCRLYQVFSTAENLPASKDLFQESQCSLWGATNLYRESQTFFFVLDAFR